MFIFCMVIYVCDYKSIPSVYFVALQVLSLNIVKLSRVSKFHTVVQKDN